jgi:hypothetical protein
LPRFNELAGHRLHVVGEVGRQTRLTEQERQAFRLGTAVSRGDRRAQHRLRLHVLCEVEERVRRAILFGLDARAVGQIGQTLRAGQFRRQLAVLDAFEIREDRLLDQPVRSAFETGGGIFQPGTQEVVDLDAKGGASHVSFSYASQPAPAKDLKVGRIVRLPIKRCNHPKGMVAPLINPCTTGVCGRWRRTGERTGGISTFPYEFLFWQPLSKSQPRRYTG